MLGGSGVQYAVESDAYNFFSDFQTCFTEQGFGQTVRGVDFKVLTSPEKRNKMFYLGQIFPTKFNINYAVAPAAIFSLHIKVLCHNSCPGSE